ncbi:MAG TPA: ATP-binding protein, partial [bacterium]
AVVGYKTFPLVLESKEKITHALNVYNTLTLLKESIIRKNIIWALASLIIVGLAVAAVAAAKALSTGISEPIQDLVGGMHRVASGDFSRTVESKAKDEFRFLIDSFNVMMRELQTTRQQLVQAEKRAAWQEAAKRISHEIRNALTPIFLSLRRIKTAQPGATPKKAVSDHFRVIDEELASLERMSASFSEFARMPQPQKIRLNLNDVVSAALRVAEQESDTVRFRPDLSPEPLMLDADREQVRRLLHNLFKNAAEASAPNTEICIRTRQEKAPIPSAVIEIEDHGEGMAPDNLARLFQPYFTTKKKGTGLGLVIAQKIAEDHGGKITARSEKGKGTVMRVAIPLG